MKALNFRAGITLASSCPVETVLRMARLAASFPNISSHVSSRITSNAGVGHVNIDPQSNTHGSFYSLVKCFSAIVRETLETQATVPLDICIVNRSESLCTIGFHNRHRLNRFPALDHGR